MAGVSGKPRLAALRRRLRSAVTFMAAKVPRHQRRLMRGRAFKACAPVEAIKNKKRIGGPRQVGGEPTGLTRRSSGRAAHWRLFPAAAKAHFVHGTFRSREVACIRAARAAIEKWWLRSAAAFAAFAPTVEIAGFGT